MKTKYLSLIFTLIPLFATADVGDLLITEISVTPTVGEFIEIHNSGAVAVDLTDVYLTDATFSGGSIYYYQIVTGGGGGGGFADFHSRFPNGAMIAAGEYQTIALNGSTNFNTTYGVDPTYELYEDAGAADAIPDMLEATSGSINGQGGLSGGEVAILYTWDGASDLVQDLDYVVWGDKTEAVDKSAVAIDGPDADAIDSTYLNETDITSQKEISTGSHASGMSWQRDVSLDEGAETQVGGNGFSGSDETSEDLNNTFYEGTPTPNIAGTPPPPTAPNILINEVDAVGTAEFIEIFGTAGASLNDVTVVLYQGSDNTISALFDLSAFTMPASGYFLIGDATLPAPDITLPANSLDDNNSGAVAVYFSNVSNFTIGGALVTTDLIDALVYDSGQADNATLLTLLNAGQAQVDENANTAAATESNARCPNGGGSALNTDTYMQVAPTAGTINNTCPVTPYYASADPTDATTLRTSLHNIIKGHISYPYSATTTDTWDILGFADEDHNLGVDIDPNVSERVWMIYKNNSYVHVENFGGEYNREHTWPQSYGFSSSASGGSHNVNNAPRTDAHHLMISDIGYNGDRGNLYFDNCDAACTELVTTLYDGEGTGTPIGGGSGTYPGNSNWFDSNSFEVWNERKGDIARAMFYMDVRYENNGEIDSTGTPEPDLVLTDDLGLIGPTSGDTAYLGLKSILIQWHNQDPVDPIEEERNEVVFSYQGNRNPFIDHPEWVECIFNGGVCTTTVPDEVFSNGFE